MSRMSADSYFPTWCNEHQRMETTREGHEVLPPDERVHFNGVNLLEAIEGPLWSILEYKPDADRGNIAFAIAVHLKAALEGENPEFDVDEVY